MSDEQDNYEDEFEQQPAPSSSSTATAPTIAPLPLSPSASHKPSSSIDRVLTSPLSQRLSSRSSTSKTNRTARAANHALTSPSHSNAAAQSAANNKRALAMLESASNPALVIQQLQEWNDGLQQQLVTAQSSVKQLEQHHQTIVDQLHGAQRQTDELASQLHSTTTQYGALKQQHTSTLTQLAKLEQSNVDLLAGQVKEKNQRQDMEARLGKCETALRREREDNARLRAEKKEKEVQKRVEDEQVTQQREGWRQQNVDLLTRIDSLDNTIKQLRHSDKANLTAIQSLQQTIAAQQQTIALTDDELVTAIRRANEHADNATHTSEQLKRAEELVAEKAQVVVGLERTVREQKDEIREKTDRITSVVFQMSRIDEWKLVKEDEEKEKAAVMMEMRGVVESQEKAMNAAMVQKDRSDAMVSILEERLGKEGKRLQELRDKQGEMERLMKGVVAQLRDKEAEYDQLAIKYSHVSGKWTAEQQARQQERRLADGVERRYNEAREEIDRLVVQLQRLEDEKVVREEILKDKDTELTALKRKDDFYKKIQDMLASSADPNTQGLLALLDSNNTQHVHYTNPQTKGRLKLALQSPIGQRLRPMLRRLEVESRELMDWSIEPQRLVDGLYGVLMRVKTLRAMEAFGGRSSGTGSVVGVKRDSGVREEKERGGAEREEVSMVRDEHERELELVNSRNALLNTAVVKAEADKSKAVLRLVHVVAGKESTKAATDNSDSTTQQPDKVFITQAETETQDATPPTATATSATPAADVYSQLGLDALVLSELGLKDEHVELMLPSLAGNRTVKEVDLRGNQLGNSAIVELVEACLTEGNRVHMIDVQQNAMTLDGLEDLVMMIMRWSKQQQQQQEDDKQTEEKEALLSSPSSSSSSSSGSRIHSASLYRQGSSLLPILQLRLTDKLLLVDMRYNRLQHVKSGSGSSSGESVKQLMKRVLLRVCRVLNSVGSRGSDESVNGVDWDKRNEWMTTDEVSALVDRNSKKKQHEDKLKSALATTFDTQYAPPPNRKTSDLDAKNVNTVRPVLPPAPKRLSTSGVAPLPVSIPSPAGAGGAGKSGSAGKGKEGGALPSLSRGGSQSGSRVGSASGLRLEEEQQRPEQVRELEKEEETKVAEPAESASSVEAVVENAVEASEDEYAQDDEYGAEEFASGGTAGEAETVLAE